MAFDDMKESIGEYKTNVKEIMDEFSLEFLCGPSNLEDIMVYKSDVNRPGLALSGFFDKFDSKRIQLIGNAEYSYLSSFDSKERAYKLSALCKQGIPAIIITTNLPLFSELIVESELYGVPVLRTNITTSRFQSALIAYLNVSLAPRITRHGVLVEVYGEGILILGESGLGKSETAIELVKRGHRLIADDAVEIKRTSARALVGSSPPVIKYFVELRGIGIVDIRRLFGMGAVKDTEKIDLVIKLEQWDKYKSYDRLGLENEYTNILGIDVPTATIPIRPGRNLAVIIEVAAMNMRQKRMGYNTAEEFNQRLTESLKKESEN